MSDFVSGFDVVWIGNKYVTKRQLLSGVNTEIEIFKIEINENNA